MRNDKLIPGLILVLIGAAFLLNNFGYLHFHWYNIFHLWPIFLVIGGVNLVFAHNKSIWATAVKIGVVVLGLGMLFFGNFGERYNFWPGSHYTYSSDDNSDNDNDNNNSSDDDDDDDDDDNKSDVKVTGKGAFNEPYKAGINVARLNISGGGTTYNLSDTTNQLFNAITKDGNGRYDFSHNMDDSVYVLDFHMKNHSGINFDSNKNQADIRLNPNPEWEIIVETGATKLDFDLSKFKVRKLKLHGGAASFNVKLGAPLANTDVDIQTGVSGVDIRIPQNAACSVETDSGLSDNHFDGFNKTSDNNYETPGFAAAKNKIHIHMSGGLSDFKVSKY
jgi:hypothetical protein